MTKKKADALDVSVNDLVSDNQNEYQSENAPLIQNNGFYLFFSFCIFNSQFWITIISTAQCYIKLFSYTIYVTTAETEQIPLQTYLLPAFITFSFRQFTLYRRIQSII